MSGKPMFKWDKKRGLCMKSGECGRYYAISDYSDGHGEEIADFLSRAYPNYENAKIKKMYKSLGMK